MENKVFFKKLIFALSTGSILFYLVSFNSVGKTRGDSQIQLQQCKVDLLKIRSGQPRPVKYQYEVTPSNVLSLSELEQKMVTQYMKKTNHTLYKDGIENPFFLTTYRMESTTRNLLGYKIVVDTVLEDQDVMTFYLTKKKKMLFWYLDTENPQQEWTCLN